MTIFFVKFVGLWLCCLILHTMFNVELTGKSLFFLLITCLIASFDTNAQDATVTIHRNRSIRSIPDDLYGYNGTAWSGSEQNGSNTQYNNLLKNAGFKIMRWPGGSWGDAYAWNDMQCGGNTWIVSYEQSKSLYNSLGIMFQPIVNFSGWWCGVQHTDSAAVKLAADWVEDGALGAKYWEIGNELMGSWEQGHTIGSDYGNRFANFYNSMKVVNSNIKIIAVGDPNDKDDSFNPGTGIWTRELLKASLKKGVIPDGFQIHNYPGAEGNYGLLHHNIDEIGKYTKDLNYMLFDETGKGQSDYCFTEFGASGNDRWLKMIGAQFTLQYLMEMAKYDWSVANIFGEIFNTTTYRAAPVWYVYAFLNGKFGRNMVHTTSSFADIRSYASVDADSNLTIWICNNSLDSSQVKIKLSDFIPASNGEIWIMEGADGLGEESYDLLINGDLHPSEANAISMSGDNIAVDTSFVVNLPKSSIALIKMAPASNEVCILTEINPQMKLNNGEWESNIYASVGVGDSISISPSAPGTGTWSWSGPNNFIDSVPEIILDSLHVSGEYIASYTNECGATSKKGFLISVIDSNACDSTYIIPYLKVSGQEWQSVVSAIVMAGSSIQFGPQPFDGTWSWSGPNGYIGSSREITVSNIQSSGTYRVTHTNSCGAKSRLTFHIDVEIVDDLIEPEVANDLIIYPIPAHGGFFMIKSNVIVENLDIRIYNFQGEQVFCQANVNYQKYIITGLQQGIYIVKLSYRNNQIFRKLIIEP
jgi:hypothetical protein